MSRDSYVSDEKLGSKFYLTLFGVVFGIAIGAILVFWLFGAAWERWGGLGALIFIGLVMIAIAYIVERREDR